jgi:excisionase family DNA binding protein
MGEPKLKHLLTAEEVAKMLNVDVAYVWKMAREGTLPKVPNLGKRIVRFNPDLVEKRFFSDKSKKL